MWQPPPAVPAWLPALACRQRAEQDKQESELLALEAEGDRMRDANARLAQSASMKERVLAVREAMVAALEAGAAAEQPVRSLVAGREKCSVY